MIRPLGLATVGDADVATLEARFLDLLLERTSAALSVRNVTETAVVFDGKAANPLDAASTQLEQALLLSRAPERGERTDDRDDRAT